MAESEAQVRKYLDPEEPNYAKAAAALGAEPCPFSSAREGADPLLASKAAYLASLIPDPRAARVLEVAARSPEATVRVAAAAAAHRHPELATMLSTCRPMSTMACGSSRQGGKCSNRVRSPSRLVKTTTAAGPTGRTATASVASEAEARPTPPPAPSPRCLASTKHIATSKLLPSSLPAHRLSDGAACCPPTSPALAAFALSWRGLR